MSSYNNYYPQEPYNTPYSSGYEQPSAYAYPDQYLPTSSSDYGSVPMKHTTSDSSMGSHNSFNSRNSQYTSPSSSDEYYYNTQTISPTTTHTHPHIDVSYAPSVNTSTKGTRKSTTSTSASNQQLTCLYPSCDYQTKRQYDLDRHIKTHFPSDKFDCPGRGCGRTGEHGFDRKDHLREHLRKVHAKDIPKQNRRNSKSAAPR